MRIELSVPFVAVVDDDVMICASIYSRRRISLLVASLCFLISIKYLSAHFTVGRFTVLQVGNEFSFSWFTNPGKSDASNPSTTLTTQSIFASSSSNAPFLARTTTYEGLMARTKLGERFLTTSRKAQERLGNGMFQYASMYGIAKKYNMTPVLRFDEWIFNEIEQAPVRAIFLNSSDWQLVPWFVVSDNWPCADSSALMHPKLSDASRTFIQLRGYFQSYKYFRHVDKDLLSQFVIRQPQRQAAEQFMQSLNVTYNATWISVHIRRSDMITNRGFFFKGYQTATATYLQNAVSYYESKFVNNLLIFVVCSDDLSWSRANFPKASSGKLVFFVDWNKDNAISSVGRDFAIQLMCNHSIMSVGSYGFWVSYLKTLRSANSIAVYYNNPFRKQSELSNEWNQITTDYYPPEWIALPG